MTQASVRTLDRTLAAFARACGGLLQGADRAYTGVSTDTRTLTAGELFVALCGPNFNGNEFVDAAAKRGAAGAVVARTGIAPAGVSASTSASPGGQGLPLIVVDDTQAALEKAASDWRARFDIPVIGVAGSNGKTTVKEMIAAILNEQTRTQGGATLSTRGNLNNHIGVPLTVLRLESAHSHAVVEMGANHPGELAALVGIARPTIGLITNAGAEHLEGFGSIEGAARAEGEMVAGLGPGGTAIINADDEFAGLWRGMTRARIVTFGLQPGADFTARDVRTDPEGDGFVTRYSLRCPLGSAQVELKLAGGHNVANSLAAAAAAATAGATLQHIVAGLGAMRAVKGRLQFKKTRQGAWLIDDSYNANPSSVHAGIHALNGLPGRKWLVFGQMNELGASADEAHTEIGLFARAQGIERLFAVGPLARLTADSFGDGARWFEDVAELSAELSAQLSAELSRALNAAVTPEIALLVKGSRSNRLERVVEALMGASSDGSRGEVH